MNFQLKKKKNLKKNCKELKTKQESFKKIKKGSKNSNTILNLKEHQKRLV